MLFFNCCLARAVIHLHLPGWETLFGFVDLQHISCELLERQTTWFFFHSLTDPTPA